MKEDYCIEIIFFFMTCVCLKEIKLGTEAHAYNSSYSGVWQTGVPQFKARCEKKLVRPQLNQ
jgi:hypothetical protein